MEVIPAILAVQLSLSKRGGQILHFGGRSYQVTIGKTVLPVEETYSAEELILLSPTFLGKPRYTSWYLRCRTCKVRASIKRLDDGTFFAYQIHSGLCILLFKFL
jgi:hypothetical protein